MKLKNNIKYEIKDNKMVIDLASMNKTKVFASNFGSLLGVNKYNSIGQGLLRLHMALEKEPFDKFYTVRGALAEYVACLYMINLLESKGFKGLQYRTFERFEFDMFDKEPYRNEYFGGKPDIEFEFDSQNNGRDFLIVEVKSKSLDKMNGYVEDEAEVVQGELYCVLRNTNKLVMLYVFINEDIESMLKAWVENQFNDPKKFSPSQFMSDNSLKIDNFKFVHKFKTVNLVDVKDKCNQVYKKIKECRMNGYIPIEWFNAKDLQDLDLMPF